MMKLDKLVNDAIRDVYYTADGTRVMLEISALVGLGLVDSSAISRLKQLATYGGGKYLVDEPEVYGDDGPNY